MTKLEWLHYRLRAMSFSEVLWRLQQKMVQRWEYVFVYKKNRPVWDFSGRNPEDRVRPLQLISFGEKIPAFGTLFTSMVLPGEYSYSFYRKKWNAGYQTENFWPEEPYSLKIPIASREEIGDIRTNWELSRHLQFPCLAKNYYMTGNTEYEKELEELFYDWNRHNLFLHGVEWNSPMEIAIRSINWMFTADFLEKSVSGAGNTSCEEMVKQLKQGSEAMTEYIIRHRSRGSSANNHLIVELAAVGIAGIYMGREEWKALAIKELTAELSSQFWTDGVNREMALHYQAFAMEAYGLLGILLRHSGDRIPEQWIEVLDAASGFLSDCCGNYGEILDFGDNDGGRILDLTGDRKDYYSYVLQLMGVLLKRRYTGGKLCETLCWITDSEEQQDYENKECYCPSEIREYPQGGYTILRSRDGKLLMGFDHGPLGYGTLAAHGHADALSIQVFYEGKPLLADPGTGSYHVPELLRGQMRSTKNHNTVWVEDMDQAEMLGPFLWGERYRLLQMETDKTDCDITICAGISYKGIVHHRKLSFDYERKIRIEDEIVGKEDTAWQCWCLPEGLNSGLENSKIILQTDAKDFAEEKIPYSLAYNSLEQAECIRFRMEEGKVKTVITVKDV